MKKLNRGFLFACLNAAAFFVFLYVADRYLEQKGFRPYNRTYPGHYEAEGVVPWARPDPVLGWTINPDFLPHEINRQGFRDKRDFDDLAPHSGKIRILILGDSFVVGSNLSADQTLPGLLQAKLGNSYEVFNLAVPGWGIDQMYFAYQRYKNILAPAMVVLAFIDDDVTRVLEAYRVAERLTKPTLTVEDGKLAPQKATSKSQLGFAQWIGKSIFLSLIAREIYLLADAKPVVAHIFLAIGREMKQKNGTLIALRIPTTDQDEPIKTLRRRLMDFGPMLARTGATYLEADEEITRSPHWRDDLYLADGHMNAQGTKLLVNLLFQRVFENR